MLKTRQQLTLFISDKSEIIEQIRAEFNHIQFNLISAHVTLCREDEIKDVSHIIENIRAIKLQKPILINFDLAKRFAKGKGVFIPGKGKNIEFTLLRKSVLNSSILTNEIKPHITLMHPRNSTCSNMIFERIIEEEFPKELSFDTISLIEQKNRGKWKILNEFNFVKS